MKPSKENYEEYKNERNRRQEQIKELWRKYHKLMNKIREAEDKLHKDYPELAGEDPGY
jgi:hypothetical protein